MNILYLDHFNFHGGAQEYILDIAEELNRDSEHCCWLTKSTVPTLIKRLDLLPSTGFGIFQKKSPFFLFSEFRMIQKIIIDKDIDIVHCNSVPSLIYGFFVKKFLKCPVVYTAHDCNLSRIKILLLKIAPNEIIAVSNAVKNYLLGNGIAAPISMIYNGIPDFVVKHIQSSYCRVVLPGRIAKSKGIELFISAAEIVNRKFPDVKFVILGHGEDLEYVGRINDLVSTLDYITILPFTTSKSDLYGNADIIVNASTYIEPLGRTLIEAGVASLPVVGPNKGGPLEIIANGYNGLLFNSCCVNSLADVLTMICSSESVCTSMGKNSRNVYESTFTIRIVVQKIIDLYEKMLLGVGLDKTCDNLSRSSL